MLVTIRQSKTLWHQKVDDQAQYARAKKSFNIVLDYLVASHGSVTAVQADCLYRIMRYEGKHSVRRKVEYIGEHLGPKILKSLKLNENLNYGLIGGALGSTTRHLKTSKNANRLVTFLDAVRSAPGVEQADAVVRTYLKNPISGLGRSIISSFLFAIRPFDYPIVNGGVSDGLGKVVEDFSTNPDVRLYLDSHVYRLRVVKQKMGFRDFGEFDSYFGFMGNFKGSISSADRFAPLNERERANSENADGIEEGLRTIVSREISIRNPRARLVALARGFNCQVCGFNFETFYGSLGAGFAEVHHLKQMSLFKSRMTVPEKDLVVLCSNCHRMIHRSKTKVYSWKALQRQIRHKRNKGKVGF